MPLVSDPRAVTEVFVCEESSQFDALISEKSSFHSVIWLKKILETPESWFVDAFLRRDGFQL